MPFGPGVEALPWGSVRVVEAPLSRAEGGCVVQSWRRAVGCLFVALVLLSLEAPAAKAEGPLESCRRSRSPLCEPVRPYDHLWPHDGVTASGHSATAPPAGNPPGYNEVATGFTVPRDADVLLDQIELLLFPLMGPGTAEIKLLGSVPSTGDVSGESPVEPDPSTVIASFDLTGLQLHTFEHVMLKPRVRQRLEAGEVYWVVLSVKAQGSMVAWVGAPSASGDESAYYAERNSSLGRGWVAFDEGGHRMRVTAIEWVHPRAIQSRLQVDTSMS